MLCMVHLLPVRRARLHAVVEVVDSLLQQFRHLT